MSKLIELSGQRFGRLTVIEQAEDVTYNNGRRVLTWRCICDCGRETIVRANSLRNGTTKSCGCYARERQRDTHLVHGKSKTRLHRIWIGMKNRCYNPNNKSYADYGGRGIVVCNEWRNSFEMFHDWALANGYSDKLSIDRVDVNGNYEPSNCRWATQTIQSNNVRRNRMLALGEEQHTLSEWSRMTGLQVTTIICRLKRGWPVERALTEKAKER